MFQVASTRARVATRLTPPAQASNPNAPFAQTSVPQNYNQFSTLSQSQGSGGSNLIYIIMGVVVLVIIVAAVLFLMR